MSSISAPQASRAVQIVAAACVLAVLYFGREILAPIALAGVLSLVLAPLKRRIARTGLGHTAGAVISVLLAGAAIAWAATLLTSQFVAVATELPRYQEAVRTKLQQVMDLTVRPLERIHSAIDGVVPQPLAPASKPRPPVGEAAAEQELESVERSASAAGSNAVARVLSSLWGPVSQAGIVLVLLVFILLEQEALRDRMISLAGEAEVGRTMQAIEDAAQGVSRFFFCQLVVNATFGIVLGLALYIVGVPHAALWGALGGLARFVPYVGALGAGAAIAAFSAAVDPGWALMFWSIGSFLVLEMVVAHLVEPQVYGHSAGLAPLGVIVSALFWGALWGPLGLLLSTPLTLCLVVAGRHVRALEPISIVFGEAPGLTAGLRAYQRALAGEPQEIVSAARPFLRRDSFVRYCDQVLLPALSLAAADFRRARIGAEQLERVRLTIASVTQALASSGPVGRVGRRRSTSLLDADVGAHLREIREERVRLWPGPRPTPEESVVLCVGLGTARDDLTADLLVQALRDEGIEALKAILIAGDGIPRDLSPAFVSTVFLAYPLQNDHAAWQSLSLNLRDAFPHAMLLTARRPLEEGLAEEDLVRGPVDLVVRSFSEVVAFVMAGRTQDRY